MTENNKEDSINARGDNTPGVKKNKGGRPRREHYEQPVNEILAGTAPAAALILKQHIERRRGYRSLASSLQRACEFVIEQTIGKARQKVELSGGVMTYGELAKAAKDLDNKPRPVLAEALEIAHKYQEKTPAPADDTPGNASDNDNLTGDVK